MRRALAVVAVLALCLTGCTEDEKTPTGTTSSPPPTGPTDPTTGATPTTGGSTDGPPVLPDAAKAKTTAGAKAFVKFYVTTLNYSWISMRTQALRTLSTSKCRGCRLVAQQINKVNRNGGLHEGATWHVRSTYLVPLQPRSSPIINVAIRNEAGRYAPNRNAKARPIDPSLNRFDFHLMWISGWTITKLVSA